MCKIALFIIGFLNLAHFAAASDLHTHTTAEPEHSFKVAATYYLPDYQSSFPKRSSNVSSGGDPKLTCKTYGYFDTTPANMNCTVVQKNPRTCYSCTCKAGYVPNADKYSGCIANCVGLGYASVSSFSCALGQTIEYCPQDHAYGKCVGTPCPTGTTACESGKYCSSWATNSRPGICPNLCNNCVNCPTNQLCSGTVCSISEARPGCSTACVKCCPVPLSCKWGCQKFSTEANCGSVCTECKAPVCNVPAGSDWVKDGSGPTPPTVTASTFYQYTTNVEKSGPDDCGNAYTRNCLIPMNGSGWNLLSSAIPQTSVAPTQSTGNTNWVTYKTDETQTFVSCDKSYSRPCKNYISPRWKQSPVTTPGSTTSTPYECTMSTTDSDWLIYMPEETNCAGIKYYSCCKKPNPDKNTGFTLVATNDTTGETWGPYKTTTDSIAVSGSKIGIMYTPDNELLHSCGNRYERTCKTYYFSGNGQVLPIKAGSGTSTTTPTPGGTTSVIVGGVISVTEEYENGCGITYAATCRVPKDGAGYSEKVCGPLTADWSVNYPSGCGPMGAGVIETKLNCGTIYYKCNYAGVSQSPVNTTAKPCYYNEGEVQQESFTECGKTYERLCINFNPGRGWVNTTPDSGPSSTVQPGSIYRDDNCGHKWACKPDTTTTPTDPSGTGGSGGCVSKLNYINGGTVVNEFHTGWSLSPISCYGLWRNVATGYGPSGAGHSISVKDNCGNTYYACLRKLIGAANPYSKTYLNCQAPLNLGIRYLLSSAAETTYPCTTALSYQYYKADGYVPDYTIMPLDPSTTLPPPD